MIKVLVHGCFDVIHHGHLKHFEEAKKYGERLIVSITSDRYVNKGPGRPYFSAEKRASMVKALGLVDETFISDEPTAIGAIRKFQPDFYVKGPDYKDFARDVTGEILNEKKAVEEVGGKLVFTEEETFSSGTIINRFFQAWSDEQRAVIDQIRHLGGIEAIEKAIGALNEIRVLVVGEPIIDVYRFVTPEGISSKSPSISARFQYEERYEGGSIAIKNHLLGFSEKVNICVPNIIVPEKIRYISGSQRIFEVTHIEDQKANEHLIDRMLEQAKEADVVILADFGHGLFEGPMLDACENISTFVGLNVQTNSSNFGFNVFTKHKRFDYLCIDTREARLAEHDRYSSPIDLVQRIRSKQHPSIISMTAGPNGSYMLAREKEFHCPAFSDNIIDAVGAGDCFFAISTCLLTTGCKEELIPFIANVAAGLKCKIVGNKSSVSKASLLKACASILK